MATPSQLIQGHKPGGDPMLDNFPVRIEYANLAKMNRIRGWARKHGANVQVKRYARDAYEGRVLVPFPWNKGKMTLDSEVAELKALIQA
jgi:hypothetical protein